MFNFEKLEVYQKSIDFVCDIYKLTEKFPKEEVYGITNQLKRAAVSVSSNVAEGSGRTRKDFRNFLRMARTSIYECVSLLQVSKRLGYIERQEHKRLYERSIGLAQMISALIKSIKG